MRMFNDAPSYVTPENAIKKLDKVLTLMQLTRDDVKWCVIVNCRGRYVPAINIGHDHRQAFLMQAAHVGVCVF
jgi:hypothetical protein